MHNSKVETFNFIHSQTKNNTSSLRDEISRVVTRKTQSPDWYSSGKTGLKKGIWTISLMEKGEFSESEKASKSMKKNADRLKENSIKRLQHTRNDSVSPTVLKNCSELS